MAALISLKARALPPVLPGQQQTHRGFGRHVIPQLTLKPSGSRNPLARQVPPVHCPPLEGTGGPTTSSRARWHRTGTSRNQTRRCRVGRCKWNCRREPPCGPGNAPRTDPTRKERHSAVAALPSLCDSEFSRRGEGSAENIFCASMRALRPHCRYKVLLLADSKTPSPPTTWNFCPARTLDC